MQRLWHVKKFCKQRCKVNLIFNRTCRDIHLKLIRESNIPRAFLKIIWPFNHFVIKYYNTKVLWMISDIFTTFVHILSNKIRHKVPTKTLWLLMEKFIAHEIDKSRAWELTFKGGFKRFQYNNVTLWFLPPNITSIVQPLYQLISSVFKAHYCCWITSLQRNDADRHQAQHTSGASMYSRRLTTHTGQGYTRLLDKIDNIYSLTQNKAEQRIKLLGKIWWRQI